MTTTDTATITDAPDVDASTKEWSALKLADKLPVARKSAPPPGGDSARSIVHESLEKSTMRDAPPRSTRSASKPAKEAEAKKETTPETKKETTPEAKEAATPEGQEATTPEAKDASDGGDANEGAADAGTDPSADA